MIKKYLLAPGPTPVPPEVLLAMAQPIIHHRTPQFEAIFAEVRERPEAALRDPRRCPDRSPRPAPARWKRR